MAERAFLRRVKIIIGVPQIDTAGYVYQEDVQQTGGINLGRVVNVPATSVPAGKVINLSNVAPNPSRAFYFKLESTRGGTEGGSANEKSVVELQNLNEETLELLHQPNAKVMVYLGYEGTSLDLYYTGDIYDIQPSGFGQGDITYRITCKDGFLDNKNTRVAIAYDESTSLASIVTDLASKIPSASLGTLALGDLERVKVKGGINIYGNLEERLTKLLRANGYVYFRYNGKISIQPRELINGSEDYALIGKNTYTITPDLVKSLDPIIQNGEKYFDAKNTKRGVQLTTFLAPMELGQFFTITQDTSNTLAGTYKITTIKIDANMPEGNFDVTVRGEPM